MTNHEIPQISVTGNANAEIEIKGLTTLSTIENPFFALGYKYKDVLEEEVEIEKEDIKAVENSLNLRLDLASIGLTKVFKFFYLALRDEEVAFFVTDCVAQICSEVKKGEYTLFKIILIANRFDRFTEKEVLDQTMVREFRDALLAIHSELTHLCGKNVNDIANQMLEDAENDYKFVHVPHMLTLEHLEHLFEEAWFQQLPTFRLLADEMQQAIYKANLFMNDDEANEELIRFANPWNSDAKNRMRFAAETSQKGDRLFTRYISSQVQKQRLSEFGDKTHEAIEEAIEQPRQKRKYTKRK